jgi:hypothetical protein
MSGYIVREFENSQVACTCGRGENHTHDSGEGITLIPLA